MGQAGIDKFFGSHRCNAICAHLKLPYRGKPTGMPQVATDPSDANQGTAVQHAPPPGHQEAGARHEKGICDVCRFPVMSDQQRMKNSLGAYIHIGCLNTSGTGGDPRPQMDAGAIGAHAWHAGAHAWADSLEQVYWEKEQHRREKEELARKTAALQAELHRLKAQRREDWKAEAALYQAERQKAMMPLSQAPVEKSPDQRPGSAALPMLVAKIKQMGFTDAQVSSAYLALGSEANEQQIVAYLVDGEEGRVSADPAQRSATAKPVQDTVGEKAVIRLMEMGFSAAQIESAQQACLAESGGRFVEPKELMEWLLNKVQEQAKMDDEASMAAIRKLQQQDAQAQAIRDQACLDADARLGNLNNAKLVITSPGNKGWICKHGCGTVCEEGSEDENRCSYKLSGARRQSGTGTPIAFAAVSFAPY